MSSDTPEYQAARVYQDEQFARRYDHTRYKQDKKRQLRDKKTKQAIFKAIRRLDGVQKVLDLPCGTGRLSRLLMDAGYEYTGCDVSQQMIDVAIEKVGEAEKDRFVQANAEQLPFEDNSFDCVVCVRFLGRIPPGPRLTILKELHRVSRKYLLTATGYFKKSTPLNERIGSRFPNLFSKAAKRAQRHDELRRELTEAGWTDHFWLPYKSRGLISTTKMIGVFQKGEQ